eukprot:2248469-Pleurochrysis_carterae.AAC.2
MNARARAPVRRNGRRGVRAVCALCARVRMLVCACACARALEPRFSSVQSQRQSKRIARNRALASRLVQAQTLQVIDTRTLAALEELRNGISKHSCGSVPAAVHARLSQIDNQPLIKDSHPCV